MNNTSNSPGGKQTEASAATNNRPAELLPTLEPQTNPIHSFSRTLAAEYGVTGAILMGYLAHKTKTSKKQHGGHSWHFTTLDDLVQRYPYLGRTTIHNTLSKLGSADGPLMIGNFNKKGYDRTRWYAFRHDQVRKQTSTTPLYFQAHDAMTYGIAAALLLQNLAYWIKHNRKQNPQYVWHKLSPGELAKHLPFDKSTLQRALNDLVSRKVLKTRPTTAKDKTVEYALVSEARLLSTPNEANQPLPPACPAGVGDESKATNNANLALGDPAAKRDEIDAKRDEGAAKVNMGAAKWNSGAANRNKGGAKRNMGAAKRDNNTTLIEYPLIAPHLKAPHCEDPRYVDPALSSSPILSQTDVKLALVKTVNPFETLVTSNQAAAGFQNPKETALPDQGSLGSQPCSAASVAPAASASPGAGSPSVSSAPGLVTDPDLEKQFSQVCSALYSSKNNGLITALNEVNLQVFRILQTTPPAEIISFLEIRNLKQLHQAVGTFVIPKVFDSADTLANKLNPDKSTELTEYLCRLSSQNLTQAFWYYLKSEPNPENRWAYQLLLGLVSLMEPILAAKKTERLAQLKVNQTLILDQRAKEHASPEKAKEQRADISAAEKIKVLRNSLAARNNIGAFNCKNELYHQVVDYNERALDMAYKFFQANPDLTVAHLNSVIDLCLKVPETPNYDENGKDTLWHARRGKDLAFLIPHWDKVVTGLNCVDKIPAVTLVSPEDLKVKPRDTIRPPASEPSHE